MRETSSASRLPSSASRCSSPSSCPATPCSRSPYRMRSSTCSGSSLRRPLRPRVLGRDLLLQNRGSQGRALRDRTRHHACRGHGAALAVRPAPSRCCPIACSPTRSLSVGEDMSAAAFPGTHDAVRTHHHRDHPRWHLRRWPRHRRRLHLDAPSSRSRTSSRARGRIVR